MHPHMVYDYSDVIRFNLHKDKTCLLLATNQAPLPCLMWCLFSYLIHSRPGDYLERIFIALNSDKRLPCRSPKYDFLNELRAEQDDFPITVATIDTINAHSLCMDMLIPFVNTEMYTLTHDDVIMLQDGWEDEVRAAMANASMAYHPPFMACVTNTNDFNGKANIGLEHPHNFFTVCRKADLMDVARSWQGECVARDFPKTDLPAEFHQYHKTDPRRCLDTVGLVCYDTGAWIYYELRRRNKNIQELPKLVHHFYAVSWDHRKDTKFLRESAPEVIGKLEQEIRESRYATLYDRWLRFSESPYYCL